MENSIKMDRNVPMEMRDGTVLRADVYRPDDNGRYPAILIRTPYSKQLASDGFLSAVEAAQAGFVIVIQDVRGRYQSEGKWDRLNMFEIEGSDGFDSVEWIAVQNFCNGNVGLAGGSYLAAMTWIGAMENPPHLKAISPWIGDIAPNMQPTPRSGVINFATAADAIPVTSLDLVDKLEEQGQDVAELRSYLNKILNNPKEVIEYLPLKDIPLARNEIIRSMWEARLKPGSAQEQNKRKKYEKVKVPGLHVGGWYDQLEWATFENFLAMQDRGGCTFARENQNLLVGPWMHGAPVNFLGERSFGASAGGGKSLEIHEYLLNFFRKHLTHMEISLPTVKYFVMGSNEWKSGDSWPLPETKWVRYFFHSNGKANTMAGDGELSIHEPYHENPDSYVYDPHDPVPTLGGKTMASTGLIPGPFDQTRVANRNDVLCYQSCKLEEDIEITGPIKVRLFASTTAVDTDFTAKLVDVYPDGRAFNIADGIQRASYRDWNAPPTLVKPGEINEYIIDMGNTSNMFRKGHRIRIDVSSSNFPWYDRNMNTGNPIGEDRTGIKATQTIYHQQDFASYIDLPIIPTRKG
ncbi:CocE/NonD family hydrolase [Halalkalibacter krulwichiae]|uniref:Cocaine esterase n=1 Tax=Halalkalibacter krulwichiae TaxID=199441 RepID=A0A1X9M938_9BACI|nr:CocE/NonD family hydrolase [Halalkalibacter krulwichiae]ARK29918.1 Cocaine esterase [Halalkalibacter krulwichiae]